MKKIIFAASLLSALFLGQLANAQSVSGRINTPGFNLRVGVNDRPMGYNGYGRGGMQRQIAMQQNKVRSLKRMAWSDGFVSYRERRMIAFEQDRLNDMMNNGGRRNRW